MATDADGNLYVADTGNNRIQKFDRTGKFLVKFGTSGSGDGQLFRPGAVAAVNRSVYVADTGNARVQRFDTNGVYLNQWGTKGADIAVGDGQSSGARGGEVHGRRRAKSPGTDHQRAGFKQPLLAFNADFRQQDVTAVSQQLFVVHGVGVMQP
mgnify:CR=1 FL=1